MSFFRSIIKPLMVPIDAIGNFIRSVINCAAAGGILLGEIGKWIGAFVVWLGAGFNYVSKINVPNSENITVGLIPYVIRYIIVGIMKIINLPKCILWYMLDTIGWIFYMPIRVFLWSLDYLFDLQIVKIEHAIWNFLGQVDYIIHGPKGNYFMKQYKNRNVPVPDPNSFNTGIHVIHYPNSVMYKCYDIKPFKLKPVPRTENITRAYDKLKRCGGSRKK